MSALEEFEAEVLPAKQTRPWEGFIRKNTKEKLLASGLAVALWFVLVHESRIEYRSYEIPVDTGSVPNGHKIDDVNPRVVTVSLSGPRRAFYFIDSDDIRLRLKIGGLESGDQSVAITGADLTLPENITFEYAEPRKVTLRIEKR